MNSILEPLRSTIDALQILSWDGHGTSAWITGKGIHTGETTRVRFIRAPLEPVRLLRDGVHIPLVAENVVNTVRATEIGFHGRSVSTIEHLLAALYIMGHWSGFLIEIDGSEVPILDGSAIGWAHALRNVAPEPRPQRPRASLRDRGGSTRGYVGLESVKPGETMRITFTVGYPHPKIGEQSWTGVRHDWQRLVNARTFGFQNELERLMAQGKGMGFNGQNAVVFGDDGTNMPLRGLDEPVRHKALDLLGDLYLVGRPLNAHVVAERASHEAHVAFALALRGK
ncbi:MAG: UDP-3-O-acyl-N-acetylglucosamine deacetylase [Pleurocapsa sp. SU_196_0]|nr:UDP-3-O-acyl-N-acetylglucosamine deacetylase [Pleurocapsa sp. SU_196_0]